MNLKLAVMQWTHFLMHLSKNIVNDAMTIVVVCRYNIYSIIWYKYSQLPIRLGTLTHLKLVSESVYGDNIILIKFLNYDVVRLPQSYIALHVIMHEDNLSIQLYNVMTVLLLPYSGNFRARKLLQFRSHPWKFSPWNLGVPYPPIKFSPRNGPSYRSARVFSLESFPL